MKEDYKVDPLSIKFDQTKKDTRRDAWDRDYMCSQYIKQEPKTTKKISILLLRNLDLILFQI